MQEYSQQQLTAKTGESVVANILYFGPSCVLYFHSCPCYTFMKNYDCEHQIDNHMCNTVFTLAEHRLVV